MGRGEEGASPGSPAESGLAPGLVLDGKYRLKARVGRGGFGDVWRAEELLPDGAPFREVALKVLGTVQLDPGGWAEEAKLLASFRHPSLVPIYAAGILRDGTRFVAMEVLEGQNLAELQRARGRVPWRRVLGWAYDVASALDVIHARGVVHLDLKPANLFLANDGGVKVLDFGIARQAGVAAAPPSRSAAWLTTELGATMAQPTIPTIRERAPSAPSPAGDGDAAPGRTPLPEEALAATRLATRATDGNGRAVVGTPGFIAPEILRGREPTPAADAYALAVCIAQLVTGLLPHAAPEEPDDWNDPSAISAWLDALRGAAIEGSLRALDELPAGVRALVTRLCAADPDARGLTPGGLAAVVGEAVRMPFGPPAQPYFAGAPLPRHAEGVLFGRDDDTARLARDLAFEGCLVVQGGRGVGKTSLVRVGLVPQLARSAVDGMDDWRLVEVVPGDDPDASLLRALEAIGAPLDPGGELGGEADAEELEAWAAAERIGIVIFVDRLEEATAAAPARRSRLEALAGALGREMFAGVRLVAALTDDMAYDALATSLGAALRAGVRFVDGPSPAAARDVAIAPAELAGADVTASDAVVVEVERELRAGGARLPVAALALAAWWSTREPVGAPKPAATAERGSSIPTTQPSQASPAAERSTDGAAVRERSTPRASTPSDVASARPTPTTPTDPGRAHVRDSMEAAPTAPAPSHPVVEHRPSGKIVIHPSAPTSPAPSDRARQRRATGSQRTSSWSDVGSSPRPSGATSRGRRPAPVWRLSGNRFRDLGGVRGALARHADATLARLSPEARAIAEDLLLRLTTTDGAPRAWSERELLESLDNADGAATLRTLEAALLVTRSGGQVELSHEGLAAGWPRLAELRLARMEELGLGERLRDATATWEREGERRDFLLGGRELDELKLLTRGKRRVGLTSRERALVTASIRAERRRKLVRVAATFAAVFLVIAGGMSWRALEIARTSEEQAKNLALELEYIGDLAAKSRRAHDPYARVAFAAEAMTRGSIDAALPLEIALAGVRAARADVLTLEPVSEPSFYWDQRWLLALGASGDLVAIDFAPKEPEVFDDLDLDVDPTLAERAKRPHVTSLRLFQAPIAEIVPFRFDTSFVARSIEGEVKVFRMRAGGAAALAAVAPMRCAGAVHVARAAPVVACAVEAGLARWDLRQGAKFDLAKTQGAVEDVSPDGARIVGRVTRRIVVWTPRTSEEVSVPLQSSISYARFSPDGGAIAVAAGGRLVVLDASAPTTRLFTAELGMVPVSARWDAGGVDVASCDASGVGRWTYLRSGARSADDPPPLGDPCRPLTHGRPDTLAAGEVPDELAGKDIGNGLASGGFRLPYKRFLSRELVLFDAASPAASALLAFHAKDELGEQDDEGAKSGPSRVVREGSVLAVQMSDEVRIYAVEDGSRYATRPGVLLGRCSDGRLLAVSREELGTRVYDVWSGATAGWVRNEPGLHWVGADSSCNHAFTQRTDGEIVANDLLGGEYGPARVIARPDGYVFDARAARSGPALGPGLWIALGTGAIAHIEDGTLAVRIVAHASPRASAIADGPAPGEVSFADAAGIAVADAGGHVRRVLESFGDDWTDLSPNLSSRSMLVAGERGVSVLDLNRNELVATLPVARAARFAKWDDDGSLLAFEPGRLGPMSAVVIPRGRALARSVASALSNLEVDSGRLAIKR